MPRTISDEVNEFAFVMFYATDLFVAILLNVIHVPYTFLYVHVQPVFASALRFMGIVGGGWLFAWLVPKLSRKNNKGS